MKKFIQHQKLMGSAFTLGIIAKDQSIANHWLKKGVEEIQRIESLLSEYQEDSITTQINNAKEQHPIVIPDEVLQLIQRSAHISKLTHGAFDITSGVLKKLYSFKNKEVLFPDQEKIKKTLTAVDYQNIRMNLQAKSITKLKPKMHISFNAIGKGYASDCVKKLWQKSGIDSGFINASGDLCAFGQKPDGSSWNIGIANPDQKNEPLLHIPVYNQSIATSGDYEQYFLWKGKRYSHNINPKTGLPLQGLKSVSIISPSAELSDALATAVYVMGEHKGMDFVNQLPKTYGIIINDQNKISFSKNLNYENVSL